MNETLARVLAANPDALLVPAGADVFEALGIDPTPDTAARRIRLRLLLLLGDHIRREGWTQAQAAERLGLDQPRVSDLLRNRIDRFSIDKLVTLLALLDVRVDRVLDDALATSA